MKKFSAVVIILLFGYWYAYNLPGRTTFIGDFSRDLYDLLQMSQGHFRLIGPKLSFGGLYSGPWYYYLFLPVYWLAGRSIDAVLYFNVFLHLASLYFCFWLINQRYGSIKAYLFLLVLATLPLLIFSAQNPGNAFTYLPLLSAWLVYFFTKVKLKTLDYFWAGLTAGLIVTFHFITVLLFLPIWGYLFLKKKGSKEAILTVTAFALPFFPLVLFELKHGLVMLKNTFIDKSYLKFTQNQNIPARQTSPKNLWQNSRFIHQQLISWLGIGPLWLLGYGLLATLKNPRFNRNWGYLLLVLGLFVVLNRYQFAVHYLLPLGLTVVVVSLLMLLKTRWFAGLALGLLLINGYGFYKTLPGLKNNAGNNYRQTQQEVNLVIQESAKTLADFNVVYIDSTGRSTIGQQFRYFFVLNGFIPKTEYEYASSQNLLVFSDSTLNKKSLQKLNNYEIRQFGSQSLNQAKKIELNSGKTVYLLTKQAPH